MRRQKANEAADRVMRWERCWREWLAARASGDFARIEAARRGVEAFDREHGLRPLRVTRGA